ASARLVTWVASNPKASPQPSCPSSVVTRTSSELTPGGRAGPGSAAPIPNGMLSGNASIRSMITAGPARQAFRRRLAPRRRDPAALSWKGRAQADATGAPPGVLGPRRMRSGSRPAQQQHRGVVAQLAVLVLEHRA